MEVFYIVYGARLLEMNLASFLRVFKREIRYYTVDENILGERVKY